MMALYEIVEKVLSTKLLLDAPPVLLDIGASGEIHPEWQLIARYSVCLAFDADSRDFNNAEKESGYKKLHLVNAIVSNKEDKKTLFYLTKSPHCSSSLQPLNDKLNCWSFADLFKVESTIELNSISLDAVLKEKGITKIDWFKTDSQGTDLRLFTSLPEEIQRNVIIAQFEPGIIDAYKGEDKLHEVLRYMDMMPYWASEIIIKGTKRIATTTSSKYQLDSIINLKLPDSSCWGEMTYFNTFENKNSDRDILLGWLFSTLKQQHGFSLDLLNLPNTIDVNLFKVLEGYSISQIKPEEIGVSTKQKIKNKLIHIISKL